MERPALHNDKLKLKTGKRLVLCRKPKRRRYYSRATPAKPFLHMMGVELTCIEQMREAQIRDLMVHLGVPQFEEKGVHQDPGCVEVPSPIFKSMEDAEAWCVPMFEIFKFLKAKYRTIFQAGGGGHIHQSRDNDTELGLNLMIDLINRPYVVWAFQDSVMPRSFGSVLSCLERTLGPFLKMKSEDVRGLHLYETITPYARSLLSHVGKLPRRDYDPFVTEQIYRLWSNGAVNHHYRYPTWEWRMFDAAESWEEQKAHFNFVDKYSRWLIGEQSGQRGHRFTSLVMTRAKVGQYTLNQAATDFFSFIEMLGLNPSDYESVVMRNMPGWIKNRKGADRW